ncbi:chromosome partitioning protein ParB [Gibbsiella quercinecans]|uniref:ParB/RepB/Spo0J family partition protein n=1 Tax=Gibbsiella quercinecans TaxID=929813 RepID=UPI000EF18899|nr:ParB/RepB/Spo0J family partition protein [Gibbsiella quercinecans]RLM11777.1 chromosome partitioning protein ParB [Gibbsiella quercinecans]
MAKNFKDALRKKRENAVSHVPAESPTHERELALPHENLNQQELKVGREEDAPAGQIIRVAIDEVYALAQVRPEEDFEEATIEGMKSTFDEFGILSPPRCFPRDKRGYRIWMGETRWRSAKARGDTYIDIYVGSPPENEVKRIYGQLIENLHQSGLKPLATAIQLQELRDVHGETQDAIARRLGKPKALISKYLRLVAAPNVVIDLLKDNVTKDIELVYTLCQINDLNPDSVEKLAKLARDGKLTRQTAIRELNVLKGKPPKDKRQSTPSVTPGSADTETTGEHTGKNNGLQTDAQASPANVALNAHVDNTGRPGVTDGRSVNAPRVLVTFEDSEGVLLTDRVPDEFGQVWVALPIGTICVDATDIAILGIKE